MRRLVHLGTSLLLAACACASAPRAPRPGAGTERARAAVDEAVGAALQADAPRMLAALRQVPAAEFGGDDAAFRACVLDRLGGAEPAPGAHAAGERFADRLLSLYRRYWWRALAHPDAREAEEEQLRRDAEALLGRGAAAASMDELEPALAARLEGEGLHALLGLTRPLRELMLWSSDVTEHRDVALPDGAYTVDLRVLDRFSSLGWAYWATCGRRGTAGWADEAALYLVRPRYATLDDDGFKASFLGHETQHLSDRRRFPGLEAWRYEYRAKLTELVLTSDAPQGRARILGLFVGNQGDDPEVPHAYADRLVLTRMRQRLGLAGDADLARVPLDALHAAAGALLREDTRRLELARGGGASEAGR